MQRLLRFSPYKRKTSAGFLSSTIPLPPCRKDFSASFTACCSSERRPWRAALKIGVSLDSDGDGISGVPNWITIPSYINPENAVTQNGKYIGRFGKKAAAFNLLHQTVNAYNQDMGITSTFNPIDVYTNEEIDPEVANVTVNDLVFYLKTLKAPIQRNQNDTEVIQGRNVFEQINCTGCHKSNLTTGYSPITGLSFKSFSKLLSFIYLSSIISIKT